MKLLQRILAAVLVLGMSLSLTACSDTTWVVDYEGEKIPSGVYLALSMTAYAQAQTHEDIDSSIKDLMKQTLEGKAAKDWINERTLQFCNEYTAVERKFAEMSLELTEEDTRTIDSSVENTWAVFRAVYEENGVAKSSYRKVIENSQKKGLIFDAYYAADGVEPVSDEDLMVHFKENYASINMFRMAPKSGEDLSEEDQKLNDGLKAKADELVQQINEGSLTYGEALDAYNHYMNRNEHDSSNENDVITEDEESRTYMKKGTSNPSEKVVNAVFNEVTPDGDAKVIADGDYYYVVKRYDATKDQKNFDEMRASVLLDIKNDPFEEMVTEWGKALSYTLNDAAVKKYNPKNIDLALS